MTFARGFCAALLSLALAGAVSAATLSEADVGDFSGDFLKPTVIANGATTVTGLWSQGNDYDLLAFTGLKKGAQSLTLSFAPTSPIGSTDYSFAAGGTILYKTSAFLYSAWEGTYLAGVGIQHWNRNGVFDYEIRLGDSFDGALYLGLFGTYGTLKYTITAPGNAAAVVAQLPAAPSAVPLPAGAPLLLVGLGALALVKRRKRVRAA